MCGLTGIFSHHPISAQAIARSMDCVNHRGEDDRRLFSFSGSGPHLFSTAQSGEITRSKYPETADFAADNWLGFNRLSIVDRSEAGMQPFWHEPTQTAFMMVGEVYNYRELYHQYFNRHEQQQFFSATDTEVVFRLYLKLGAAFIHKLRGMFSIVIADYANQKVRVYRDKIGMKPLFYALIPGYFIVSSEISGIIGTGLIEKKLDNKGLAYLMYFESSPLESSVYQQILPLAPGHFLEFNLHTRNLQKGCYWHLNYQENTAFIPVPELQNDIINTAELHLVGDVPKALSLSGGLDSGLLAYAFGHVAPEIKAFSINPQNSEADESVNAALNAKNAGLGFQNISISGNPDWNTLKAYFLSEDEPNTIPEPNTFLCKAIAEQGYKVLYNALGLDELFGGYRYYQQVPKFKNIKQATHLLPYLPPGKAANLKKFGLLYLPTMKRENLSWEQLQAMFPDESQTWQHPFEYQRDLLHRLNPDLSRYPILKQFSYWDLLYYVGAHHTFRSDQSAMKATIEMRFPFLDAEFVQKYFQYSRIYENIEKENKPLIRTLARKLLPAQVLEMPKKGFTMPVKQWLAPHRQNMENQLQEVLAKNLVAANFIQKHKQNAHIQWQLASLNMLF